jgi:aldehyde:ferredoxin oxidoreductase
MLDKRLVNYYAFCGWDKETGIPTKERFFCLVLEDIAKDMDREKYK